MSDLDPAVGLDAVVHHHVPVFSGEDLRRGRCKYLILSNLLPGSAAKGF